MQKKSIIDEIIDKYTVVVYVTANYSKKYIPEENIEKIKEELNNFKIIVK